MAAKTNEQKAAAAKAAAEKKAADEAMAAKQLSDKALELSGLDQEAFDALSDEDKAVRVEAAKAAIAAEAGTAKQKPGKKEPATLDRTRDYGTVVGFSRARFEQDGKSFDGDGVEILE